jgi:Tol biopolymer transport system component
MHCPAPCRRFGVAWFAATVAAFGVCSRAAGAPRGSALEVIDIEASQRRTVLQADGLMQSPHFAPDGGELYFNRDGRIYRIEANGHSTPAVVDTGFAVHCNNDHGLSPDGRQFAIGDTTETGKPLMYLLPVAGGRPKRIEVAAPAYWHGWSPDGRTLVYCAAREGNYDVYTIPVAGGRETRLTTADGNDNGPDYSADGRWIYFHSNRTGRFQIWRMRADGTQQEQVTEDDNFNWFPHPSPDGRWIVILSSSVTPETGHPPDGNYVLRLRAIAGGEWREIARFYGGNGSFNVPCWSRDSTRIAYASYEPAK